jgi:hypothetical protein
MAVTVNIRPYQYSFSRNEIQYVFTLDNLTRPGLAFQLKIMYDTMTGSSPIAMNPFKLMPDADGKISINIQNYIDSILKFVLPDMAADLTVADKQLCMFWVEFREVTDADPNPVYDTSETANKIIGIKGGISKEKAARNNFFINYFNTAKPFFTWQPSARFVYLNQPIFITAFIPSGDLSDLSFNMSLVYLDGSTDTETVTLSGTGFLLHLNVLEMITPYADNLRSVTISVRNSTDVIFAANYTFNFQYRPCYKYYDLLFHNSLGGLDTVRVRGEVEWGIDKQFEETEGGFNMTEALAIVKSYETKHTAIAFNQTYKGDIGFLQSKKEQEALIELIISGASTSIKMNVSFLF